MHETKNNSPTSVMTSAGDACDPPTLADKLAWLNDPRVYPNPVRLITAIETHMSWVFLTESHAYKLKKPVRYPYLDFSTLAARERNCREEFRLNQRLAPGVYLGVVPLCSDGLKAARLEGEGRVVEWLVKMRRLPADRMLDRLIAIHAVTPRDIHSLAEWLVAFYHESAPVDVSAEAHRAQYRAAIKLNREVLARPEHELPPQLIDNVHTALSRTVESASALFDQRVREGRIIEGHGDLRPEHVCLESHPIVFDRLEFNRDLRIIDAAEELAFLSMECERLGAAFVGEILLDVYAQTAGDAPAPTLLDFFRAHRACIRARLAAQHTLDAPQSSWPKWNKAAAGYLRLAASYCDRLARAERGARR
jgi:uncharacterized protein